MYSTNFVFIVNFFIAFVCKLTSLPATFEVFNKRQKQLSFDLFINFLKPLPMFSVVEPVCFLRGLAWFFLACSYGTVGTHSNKKVLVGFQLFLTKLEHIFKE